LDARPAINAIADGKEPTKEQLVGCIATYESAIRWVRASLKLTNLASCEFSLALQESADDRERQDWLDRAAQHLVEGLQDNPMDGFAWARLAAVRSRRGARGPEVIAPLMTSLEVEPNNRQLWEGRTELVLAYAWEMSADDLFAVRRHLQTIWTYAPNLRPKLVEKARRTNAQSVLIWSLASDKGALADFQRIEREQDQ
jgi:hypothetical protein